MSNARMTRMTIATYLLACDFCITRQYSPKVLSADISLNKVVYTLLLYLYRAQSCSANDAIADSFLMVSIN